MREKLERVPVWAYITLAAIAVITALYLALHTVVPEQGETVAPSRTADHLRQTSAAYGQAPPGTHKVESGRPGPGGGGYGGRPGGGGGGGGYGGRP